MPDRLVPLPKYVHFARALAGLPRVAFGIAAGATLVTMSGCTMQCIGSYGAIPPPNQDAVVDHPHRDATADAKQVDGGPTPATDGGQGGAGGGPLGAPPLPHDWA